MKKFKTGIAGYGVSIPHWRLRSGEIALAWEKYGNPGDSLHISEKSVAGIDEDTITLATEASANALKRAGIDPHNVGAVYVGSESHPYAVKPSSVTVAEALGIGNMYMAADTEFACKAGTAAIQIVTGLVESGMIDYGLAVGADTAQGAPGDALEYSAGSGAGAFILGRDNLIAELIDTLSFTSDTPDFWRRPKKSYPTHGGRFTGEPAYFKHVENSTDAFLKKTKTTPKDYDYVIFHMPNGKFPRVVAKRLGFTTEQLSAGLTVDVIGNSYSAASLIGLCRVLDKAKPNQSILLTSYGSGSGSDSFSLMTTNRLTQAKKRARLTDEYIKNKTYITYTKYVRWRGKLI